MYSADVGERHGFREVLIRKGRERQSVSNISKHSNSLKLKVMQELLG